MALTGRFFTAEEALAANLINRVTPKDRFPTDRFPKDRFPKDRFMELAREPAALVAANPPLSVRATVRTRRWYLDRYGKEAAFQQAPLRLYLTEHFHEAALAFKEKRKPVGFKGRQSSAEWTTRYSASTTIPKILLIWKNRRISLRMTVLENRRPTASGRNPAVTHSAEGSSPTAQWYGTVR